jgi:transposase
MALQRQRFLADQVAELDQHLLELYEDTGYRGVAETMPAMTSITAALLALSGDPRDFDSGRCLAKLAGTNARENESGEFKVARGITSRGNPVLRTIAFRAAVSLAKNNPEFKSRLSYVMHRRSARSGHVPLLEKPLRDFYRQAGGAQGRRGMCKTCYRATERAAWARDPKVQRAGESQANDDLGV